MSRSALIAPLCRNVNSDRWPEISGLRPLSQVGVHPGGEAAQGRHVVGCEVVEQQLPHGGDVAGGGPFDSPHDGRDLDAVVRADAAIVLGLAAGVLTLNDTLGLIDIEGDKAAVRAVFNPRTPRSETVTPTEPCT
jgi:hypothetical protein